MRPPSWLAAMKNPTPSVASAVASAWTESVMARMPATPAVLWVVKAIDPKW